MSVDHGAPSQAHDSSQENSNYADHLRALLKRANLSQRAAARLLNIEERTMRQWCAGQGKPPAWAFRALNPRLTHAENLRRMIEADEKVIEALQGGRITGLGYGHGASGPDSVPMEIAHLCKRIEEHRALLRLDEAFQRKQEAYFRLNGQWFPYGDGLPTDESISEVDSAETEFQTAQADVNRILQEIRSGKR